MSKPIDKLPSLDPNVRGIYDLIIMTVVAERKRRKSADFMEAERRREAAAKLMHQAREIEAKKEEADRLAAQRYAEAQKLTVMLEADKPRFVR